MSDYIGAEAGVHFYFGNFRFVPKALVPHYAMKVGKREADLDFSLATAGVCPSKTFTNHRLSHGSIGVLQIINARLQSFGNSVLKLRCAFVEDNVVGSYIKVYRSTFLGS